MKELLQKIEKRMDDFTVKKKLYILYIFCVLLPLIITDSVVFLIITINEQIQNIVQKKDTLCRRMYN